MPIVTEEKLFDAYKLLGVVVGGLTFLGCWIYAIATYGLFLGLGLGWIPSAVIALIAGLLSPLVLLGRLALLGLYLANDRDAALVWGILASFLAVGAIIAWLVFDKLPQLRSRGRNQNKTNSPTA